MAIYFGISAAAKLVIAEEFYAVGNSIRAHDWAKVTDDDKAAGLAQAEREVNLYLGINLESLYDGTSFPISEQENFRPDFAIFEHALFILENTARTKGSTEGVRTIESKSYQEEERSEGVPMSPQATRYLRLNRLQISRG